MDCGRRIRTTRSAISSKVARGSKFLDPTRPTGLSIKCKNHKTINEIAMALFQSLVLYIVAAVCYNYTHISTLIRSVSQQTPNRVHHDAVRTLMKSFSIHPIFRISEVSRRFLRFSCAIVFLRPQYLVSTFHWDKTPRSTTEYTNECLRIVPALSQTIKSLF